MNEKPQQALRWLVRKIGVRTLVLFSLLIAILGSVSLVLQGIAPGLKEAPLGAVWFLALLAGWLLARSRLSGHWAALWASLLGPPVCLTYVGKLGGDLAALGWATTRYAWEFLSRQRGDPLPDPDLMRLLLGDIGGQLVELLGRGAAWARAVLAGAPAFDPLATALVWSLALWGCATWAAWAVRRRESALMAILPVGVLFSASLSYTRAQVALLLPLFASTLLLLAAISFGRRQRRWIANGIDYSEEIYFDVSLWALAFTVMIVLGATLLSYFSPQKTVSFIRDLARSRSQETTQMGESLGLKVEEPGEGPDEGRGAGGELPRSHLLYSGPELYQRVVMIVQVGGARPDQPVPGYYWRGWTYDEYTGRGWVTSPTTLNEYNTRQPVSEVIPAGFKLLEQTVRPLEEQGRRVYFTGSLVSVDQDYQVEWRPTSQAETAAETEEWDFFAATLKRLPSGNSYRVQSQVLQVGKAQLRAASGDYPLWVLERYLQLPGELPPRVFELAHEVTADATTAYDRAAALESYLRQYPYTLDVPPPPSERDVVDYFLFELKRGYCDYYATAMVVMARSVALPARLVMGYAPGSYDQQQMRFVVTEADAHTWVEIYFPDIGWVEFEPTGGRPPLERPDDLPPGLPPDLQEAELPGPELNMPDWLRWLGWAGVAAGGMALLPLFLLLGEAWWLRRLGPPAALFAMYRRLYRHGQRLEVESVPGATPGEFGRALASRVAQLSQSPRWQAISTPGAGEVQQVVALYVRSIYAPQGAGAADQRRAIRLWGRLQRRLWLARLLRWRQAVRRQS
ncbi:MAG: transglutaminase domain-containing protein [Chloroflexota bacterium]